MADVNLQRCEVCKKVNTDDSKDWVRLGGASNNAADRRHFALDFCPDCAGKTTVKDAVQYQPPMPQVASRPGPQLRPAMAAPPTPPNAT